MAAGLHWGTFCATSHTLTPQMKQFLITSTTELLLEAAVRLLVPDGGADDDVRTWTLQDVRQQLHQTSHNLRVIHHICSAATETVERKKVHSPERENFCCSRVDHQIWNLLADNKSTSDLQQWWRLRWSAVTAPLLPPSSQCSPHWPEESSASTDRSAGRCWSVSAGRRGGSRWRRIGSGCRSSRWWCRSSPHRFPAPELSCTQEDLRTGLSQDDPCQRSCHSWDSS